MRSDPRDHFSIVTPMNHRRTTDSMRPSLSTNIWPVPTWAQPHPIIIGISTGCSGKHRMVSNKIRNSHRELMLIGQDSSSAVRCDFEVAHSLHPLVGQSFLLGSTPTCGFPQTMLRLGKLLYPKPATLDRRFAAELPLRTHPSISS